MLALKLRHQDHHMDDVRRGTEYPVHTVKALKPKICLLLLPQKAI